MIRTLGWKPLEQRRGEARLVLFYKAVHGIVAIPVSQFLTPENTIHNTRHSRPYLYTIPHTFPHVLSVQVKTRCQPAGSSGEIEILERDVAVAAGRGRRRAAPRLPKTSMQMVCTLSDLIHVLY
jgi:hypothetical protein